MGVNSKQKQY